MVNMKNLVILQSDSLPGKSLGNFGDSGEFSYLGDYGITCDSGESDELLEFLIPGGSGDSGVSGKLGDSDFSDIVDTAEW